MDGGLRIAVPPKSRFSKLAICPKFSGTSSSFEQPFRLRTLRDLKSEILLGRLTSFLQSLKVYTVSLLRNLIGGGTSSIEV